MRDFLASGDRHTVIVDIARYQFRTGVITENVFKTKLAAVGFTEKGIWREVEEHQPFKANP